MYKASAHGKEVEGEGRLSLVEAQEEVGMNKGNVNEGL